MKDYILHDKDTGEIIGYGTCHDNAVSMQPSAPNHGVLAVKYQPGVVKDGALVPHSADVVQAQFAKDRRAVIDAIIAKKKAGIAIQ
jgi:hypothetical protein